MKLLTKEQQESYKNEKICYICKEQIENKYVKDKSTAMLEIIVIIRSNIVVLPSFLSKKSYKKNSFKKLLV